MYYICFWRWTMTLLTELQIFALLYWVLRSRHSHQSTESEVLLVSVVELKGGEQGSDLISITGVKIESRPAPFVEGVIPIAEVNMGVQAKLAADPLNCPPTVQPVRILLPLVDTPNKGVEGVNLEVTSFRKLAMLSTGVSALTKKHSLEKNLMGAWL